MRKLKDDPEALAFMKKHASEFPENSYEEHDYAPVSTSSMRRHDALTIQEGSEVHSTQQDVAPTVLTPSEQAMYAEYAATKFGAAAKLAIKYGFPSNKAFLDKMRDLRARLRTGARRYKADLSRRRPFMPAGAVLANAHTRATLRWEGLSQHLWLVSWEGCITWVDEEGNTFHSDALTILDNLYEASKNFQDTDIDIETASGDPS